MIHRYKISDTNHDCKICRCILNGIESIHALHTKGRSILYRYWPDIWKTVKDNGIPTWKSSSIRCTEYFGIDFLTEWKYYTVNYPVGHFTFYYWPSSALHLNWKWRFSHHSNLIDIFFLRQLPYQRWPLCYCTFYHNSDSNRNELCYYLCYRSNIFHANIIDVEVQAHKIIKSIRWWTGVRYQFAKLLSDVNTMNAENNLGKCVQFLQVHVLRFSSLFSKCARWIVCRTLVGCAKMIPFHIKHKTQHIPLDFNGSFAVCLENMTSLIWHENKVHVTRLITEILFLN